ncbi:MAG: C25 family cysteine peptidase [Bacteroidetes bacterium]|nr:C25 family cysteine peptidase [Bacteroidota bacterium]
MTKKLWLLLILCGWFSYSQGGKWIPVGSDTPSPVSVKLISGTPGHTSVSISLPGFLLNPVNLGKEKTYTVTLAGTTPLLSQGDPDLPKVTFSLCIPDQGLTDLRIDSALYRDFYDILIAPSKGNLSRDNDPDDVVYTYARSYHQNAWFPGKLCETREPFILRDVRGQTVIIHPFLYNPVTRVLRVYYKIYVTLLSKEGEGINPLLRKKPVHACQTEFSEIYNNQFLNYAVPDYTPLSEEGNMLIISYGSFIPYLQDFVNWKTRLGIPVTVVDVATLGTAANIKTFVQNFYQENGLTYLLLVGDNAQVPTFMAAAGPSDNTYGYVAGNDHYPDLFVGRFSAETALHVQTQVEKVLLYEMNPVSNGIWLEKGIGVASDQGPGDDAEYDYQHIRNLRSQLLNYSYSGCSELYDGSQGGVDAAGNPTTTMVSNEINSGVGIILYCGHGSDVSWGTSGFSNTQVNTLTNNGMLPIIWSVACVNGNFPATTCFAEAWLRARQGDQLTGAVATLMSTINQSWNPPMEGQDEMVSILTESYPGNIKRTFGGISMNGCMKMNDTYGTDGYDMTDTWNCFGDPSLMVRTTTPLSMTVTHNPNAFMGSSQFLVNCNVEGAKVCICLNGQILGTALVNGGSATIVFTGPLSAIDTLNLTVSAYNYIPYLADIPVIPASGPYIIYNQSFVNDASGNNNGLVDYGENILLSFTIQNVGLQLANNVVVSLTTADPYITITDNTAFFGTIPQNGTTSVTDAFAFTTANDIPNNHVIHFSFTATNGTNTWPGSFTCIAYAPVLSFVSYSISDPSGNNNGKLDPGETAVITLLIHNSGNSEAFDITGNLSSQDTYLIISGNDQFLGDLPPGTEGTLDFEITADPSTQLGHLAQLQANFLASMGISLEETLSTIIGQFPVLIINWDGNNNSAPAMQSAAENNGISCQLETTLPSDLNLYASIFICLGVYPNNHVLSATEASPLVTYLNNGGNLYMEGSDTWAYDPQTSLHSLFMISGVADGSADMNTLTGQFATPGAGISIGYSGENSYMDHLESADTSVAIVFLRNLSPDYGAAVFCSTNQYKTIGTSFEFGGLTDGVFPSTQNELMRRYLEFFGILPQLLESSFLADTTMTSPLQPISFTDFSTGFPIGWLWSFPGGTPIASNLQNPVVTYSNPGFFPVTLTVTNGYQTSTLTLNDYITVGANTVSGIVKYDNTAQTPLSQVCVKLKNGSVVIGQDSTLSSGFYEITTLQDGSFSLFGSSSKPWGGVNATDALLIMKHFVGLSTLTGIRKKAADVDGSGVVNSIDALASQRRSVGMINSFPAGDWAFEIPQVSMSGFEMVTANFKGLCYGDVNGSYNPPGKQQNAVELSPGNPVDVQPGQQLRLALTVTSQVSPAAVSLTIDVSSLPARVLSIYAPSDDQNLVWSLYQDVLRISWFTLHPEELQTGEAVLFLDLMAETRNRSNESSPFQLTIIDGEIADIDGNPVNSVQLNYSPLTVSNASSDLLFSPNPFSGNTEIRFFTEEQSMVRISVYDETGRLIRELLSQNLPQGWHHFSWDGTDNNGTVVRNGIYHLRFESIKDVQHQVLIKTK